MREQEDTTAEPWVKESWAHGGFILTITKTIRYDSSSACLDTVHFIVVLCYFDIIDINMYVCVSGHERQKLWDSQIEDLWALFYLLEDTGKKCWIVQIINFFLIFWVLLLGKKLQTVSLKVEMLAVFMMWKLFYMALLILNELKLLSFLRLDDFPLSLKSLYFNLCLNVNVWHTAAEQKKRGGANRDLAVALVS